MISSIFPPTAAIRANACGHPPWGPCLFNFPLAMIPLLLIAVAFCLLHACRVRLPATLSIYLRFHGALQFVAQAHAFVRYLPACRTLYHSYPRWRRCRRRCAVGLAGFHFPCFSFLSLALAKRYSEMAEMDGTLQAGTIPGRSYQMRTVVPLISQGAARAVMRRCSCWPCTSIARSCGSSTDVPS